MIGDQEFDFSAVMIVHRYYFPKEWNARFKWIPPYVHPLPILPADTKWWLGETPDLVEAQSWVSEHLADRRAAIYRLVNSWVVNTTEEDDITLLSLKFGVSNQ